MFVCCNPLIPRRADGAGTETLRLATLRSPRRSHHRSGIANVDAPERVRELQMKFEIRRSGTILSARLEGVQTLYLLFNEGFNAYSGEN